MATITENNHALYNQFIGHLKLRHYAANSIRAYKNGLKHYLEALEENGAYVQELTVQTFAEVVSAWLTLPTNTYNARISYCRKWHEWLVMTGRQQRNPVMSGFTAKQPALSRPVLKKSDVAKILLVTDRQATITALAVRLMAHAGLRVSECRRIIVQSIAHYDSKSVFQVDADKFNKSRMCVVENAVTRWMLHDYATYSHRSGKHLFLAGQPTIQRSLDAVADLSFSPTTHDLRRYYATQLAIDGVPVPLISRLLGHTNIATTQKYIWIKDRDIIEHFGLHGDQLPVPPTPVP